MDRSKYITVTFGKRATKDDEGFIQEILRGLSARDKEFITLVRDDSINTRLFVDAMGVRANGNSAVRFLDEHVRLCKIRDVSVEFKKDRRDEWDVAALDRDRDRILGTEDYHFRSVMAEPFAQVSYESPNVGPGWQYQVKRYLPTAEWGVLHPEVLQEQRRLPVTPYLPDARTRMPTLNPISY